MIKICSFLSLFLFSSCSWLSMDYWKIRSVVSNYQKEVYALNTENAKLLLTKKSRLDLGEILTKYSEKELSNYRKLSSHSSFEFKSIEVLGNEAIVNIVEKVPDFELIFGTVISLHMNKQKDGSSTISLEVLINRFIDEIVTKDPSLFLDSQEVSYLLIKEDNYWKIKLE